MRLASAVACAAVASLVVSAPVGADPAPGTVTEPVLVDALPFAALGDTRVATSRVIDAYGCAPALDESGAEVIFAFTLAAPARVWAWVQGDDGIVDVDVHLLDELTLDAGVATACAARGNVVAEAELAAGPHWVVVDTYGGDGQAGAFTLRLDAAGDAWTERPIAAGVTWRARRFADLYGGPQVVHELVVDAGQPGVAVRALGAAGCQTVGAIGAAAGAVAGVNGGYFAAGCAPVSLLKASGVLLGENAVTRGAFGLTEAMVPMVEIVAAGADWPAAHEAHGGGPVLVAGGVPYAGSGAWGDQGFSSASFLGRNPRTTAGVDGEGRIRLVTVDGRRASALGMSMDQLADFAAVELGGTEVVNLDGGGSTTLWIAGAGPSGVVNYPSDDPDQEDATHPGSRGVSGGLFVFAPPWDHPPRFQTTPPTEAAAGEPYRYDADAIDLDLEPITYALATAPAGMTVDAATGHLSWDPGAGAPAEVSVVLRASGPRGAAAEQAWSVIVAGTGGETPDAGPGAGDDAADGCGCRAARRGPPAGGAAALALLVTCARAGSRWSRWRAARARARA